MCNPFKQVQIFPRCKTQSIKHTINTTIITKCTDVNKHDAAIFGAMMAIDKLVYVKTQNQKDGFFSFVESGKSYSAWMSLRKEFHAKEPACEK